MLPLGVTLTSLYQFLRGLFGLIFGAFIISFVGPSNKFSQVSATGNSIERMIGQLGHAAGAVIIVVALVHLVAGFGLWRIAQWGRWLTILFSAIELVFLLPSAIQLNIFAMCFAVLNGLCVLYLAMPPTRRAFVGRLQTA